MVRYHGKEITEEEYEKEIDIKWKIKYLYHEYIMKGQFECKLCGRRFPMFYGNKGTFYWGDRGRYNFRGAKANLLKHIRACMKVNEKKVKEIENQN